MILLRSLNVLHILLECHLPLLILFLIAITAIIAVEAFITLRLIAINVEWYLPKIMKF